MKLYVQRQVLIQRAELQVHLVSAELRHVLQVPVRPEYLLRLGLEGRLRHPPVVEEVPRQPVFEVVLWVPDERVGHLSVLHDFELEEVKPSKKLLH